MQMRQATALNSVSFPLIYAAVEEGKSRVDEVKCQRREDGKKRKKKWKERQKGLLREVSDEYFRFASMAITTQVC